MIVTYQQTLFTMNSCTKQVTTELKGLAYFTSQSLPMTSPECIIKRMQETPIGTEPPKEMD